jgi:hypothetical protein
MNHKQFTEELKIEAVRQLTELGFASPVPELIDFIDVLYLS